VTRRAATAPAATTDQANAAGDAGLSVMLLPF